MLLSCALVSGVLALAFGILHAWGGGGEAAAAVVFGGWFLACLVLAFRAIRHGRVPQHRRWMIRAFAVGIGIGTIRIWVGLFTVVQLALRRPGEQPLLPAPLGFAVGFWLALGMHAVIGEWWLRRRPDPPSRSAAG